MTQEREPREIEPGYSRSNSRAVARAQRARSRRITVIVTVVFGVLVAVTAFLMLSANQPVQATGDAPAAVVIPATESTLTAAPPTETAEPTTTAPPPRPVSAPAFTESDVGSSVEGRAISAVVFGNGDRRYLVVGGVHGDEWGASAAEDLIKRLKADASLVPEGVQIHVISCLNPDGRAADTRGNANNVDLNRNMPAANWAKVLDPRDSSATRNLSGGATPGSEPESRAFIDYMSIGFENVVSIHSKGGLVDWDGDGGESIAKRVAKEVGYPVKHLGYQAYIRGSMGGYVPEKWSIPIVTIEMQSPGLTDGLLKGILAAAN